MNFQSFYLALKDMGVSMSKKQLEAIFGLIDESGQGVITEEKFADFVENSPAKNQLMKEFIL